MRGDAGAEGVEVVGHHDLVARRSTEVTAPAR
jgi:hypothetical protein